MVPNIDIIKNTTVIILNGACTLDLLTQYRFDTRISNEDLQLDMFITIHYHFSFIHIQNLF